MTVIYSWEPWVSPQLLSATPVATFIFNKRKIERKELPGCSISHLLIAYTHEVKILVKALNSVVT